MKRNKLTTFIGILFLATVGSFIATPTQNTEAQVLYGAYCCDGYGVRRCVINYTPIGASCYCPWQGWGLACA